MKKLLLTLAALLLASGAIAQTKPSGPLLTQTYDQAMAGSTTVVDYCFGTGSCAAGQTQISNCTLFQQYFAAQGDSMLTGSDTPNGTLGESYNSDMERFQPCNSTNFVFNPTNLTLTGVNELLSAYQSTQLGGTGGSTVYTFSNPISTLVLGLANSSTNTSSFSGTATITGGTTLDVTAVSQGGLYQGNQISVTGCPAGTFIASPASGNLTGNYTLSQTCTNGSGLTVTSSNAPQLQQMVDIEFVGWFQITAITAGTPNTITLGQMFGAPASGKINNNVGLASWFPLVVASGSSLTNGSTSVVVNSVPAGCTVGMMIGAVNSSNQVISNSTTRITAISGGTLTLDSSNPWSSPNVAAAGTIMCMQPITSAQMWEQAYELPGATGRMLGFDAYITFPGDSAGGYNALSTSCADTAVSPATIANFPLNYRWGGFPSWWAYGGNYPVAGFADNSEIDFITMRYYADAGSWVDQPGFYNTGKPPKIAAINNSLTASVGTPWSSGTTLSAGTCFSGHVVYWTQQPNNIFWTASFGASQTRYSIIWTQTQVWIYINNVPVKVMDYQWTGQGWAQVGFQMPVGNLGSSGRDLSWPLFATNFPYQLAVSRYRRQVLQ